MIVETRYRDIPWESIECRGPLYPECDSYWNQERGRAMQIIIPAANVSMIGSHNCAGPFFETILLPVHQCPYRHLKHYVCPHIAEIGD